ncbi:hypothetical protein DL96DRAFT_1678407 [Flagelloscypha sp. PMI_526]|nr:hypothetical protein DL96DRAFT_1678407 [Flagelloscypha sp. PMI_526]
MAQCVTQAVATVTNLHTDQNVRTSFSDSPSSLPPTTSVYTVTDGNTTQVITTTIPGGVTNVQVPILYTDFVTETSTSISYSTSCTSTPDTTPVTPPYNPPVTTPETTPKNSPVTTPQNTPYTPPTITQKSTTVVTKPPVTTTLTTVSSGKTIVFPTVLPDRTTSSSTPTSTSKPVPLGAVVGGSVGGAVGLALLAVLIFYLIKHKSDSTRWGEEFDNEYQYDGKNGLGATGAGHGQGPAAHHGAAGDGHGGGHGGYSDSGDHMRHSSFGGSGMSAYSGFSGGEQMSNMGVGYAGQGAGHGIGGQGFTGQGFGGEHWGQVNASPGYGLDGSHAVYGGGGEQMNHLGGQGGFNASQSIAGGSVSSGSGSAQVFSQPFQAAVPMVYDIKRRDDDQHPEVTPGSGSAQVYSQRLQTPVPMAYPENTTAAQAAQAYDPYMPQPANQPSPPEYSVENR